MTKFIVNSNCHASTPDSSLLNGDPRAAFCLYRDNMAEGEPSAALYQLSGLSKHECFIAQAQFKHHPIESAEFWRKRSINPNFSSLEHTVASLFQARALSRSNRDDESWKILEDRLKVAREESAHDNIIMIISDQVDFIWYRRKLAKDLQPKIDEIRLLLDCSKNTIVQVVGYSFLSMTEYNNGNYLNAINIVDKAFKVAAEIKNCHGFMVELAHTKILSLILLWNYDEALKLIESWYAISSELGMTHLCLTILMSKARAMIYMKQYVEGIRTLKEIIIISRRNAYHFITYQCFYELAFAYSLTGEREKTINVVEKALNLSKLHDLRIGGECCLQWIAVDAEIYNKNTELALEKCDILIQQMEEEGFSRLDYIYIDMLRKKCDLLRNRMDYENAEKSINKAYDRVLLLNEEGTKWIKSQYSSVLKSYLRLATLKSQVNFFDVYSRLLQYNKNASKKNRIYFYMLEPTLLLAANQLNVCDSFIDAKHEEESDLAFYIKAARGLGYVWNWQAEFLANDFLRDANKQDLLKLAVGLKKVALKLKCDASYQCILDILFENIIDGIYMHISPKRFKVKAFIELICNTFDLPVESKLPFINALDAYDSALTQFEQSDVLLHMPTNLEEFVRRYRGDTKTK